MEIGKADNGPRDDGFYMDMGNEIFDFVSSDFWTN